MSQYLSLLTWHLDEVGLDVDGRVGDPGRDVCHRQNRFEVTARDDVCPTVEEFADIHISGTVDLITQCRVCDVVVYINHSRIDARL